MLDELELIAVHWRKSGATVEIVATVGRVHLLITPENGPQLEASGETRLHAAIDCLSASGFDMLAVAGELARRAAADAGMTVGDWLEPIRRRLLDQHEAHQKLGADILRDA